MWSADGLFDPPALEGDVMLSGLLWIVAGAVGVEAPRLEAEAAKLGIPFDRYSCEDKLGRTITFYLSPAPGKDEATKRPVALMILGSGCQSAFQKHGEFVGGSFQNLLFAEAKGRVRVMVVEKPGVKYLDHPPRPGGAMDASEEFLKEHTLPRWAEANGAALRAAWTLPGVDGTRTLVVGHSEGGIVAARVAAERPEVTHVASLSGGGPTQLFDFVSNAARPRPDDKPGDAERRAQSIYDAWADVRKDPESITRSWLGHPYRRWSSFLERSVAEELLRAKAHVYVAAGTRDAVIPVAAHDMLVSELRARGRDVTAERVEGADHGFQTGDRPQVGPPVEMQALLGRVLRWFLAEDAKPR
jgi:pimeloyl-ACP methyl ester carboxylesterase